MPQAESLPPQDAYFIEALEGATDGAVNHFGLLEAHELIQELADREKGE
jgi:hypothetical protein